MILLWGIPADEPISKVWQVLIRKGAEVAFLDQHLVLETEVKLSVDERISGSLRVKNDVIELQDVTAFYLRPYDSSRIPEIKKTGPNSVELGHALAVEDVLVSWADITPALVVNRPSFMSSNNSKPYQSSLIHDIGFAVPDTIITTDPEAAYHFTKKHGEVIYKSISGSRSIVSRLKITEAERLKDITWCPTQFQEYIPGNDIRVHVIGEQVFACEIISAADDFRYIPFSETAPSIKNIGLPEDLAESCKKLTASLNLHIAGIDLRRTPENVWYCFEVNPCPGFSFFQEATHHPIDEAIAQLLLSALNH